MSKTDFLVFFALLFSVLQVCQGDWVQHTLYPSCTGTGFPNFSYAKGTTGGAGGRQPCLEAVSIPNSPPVTMTWFYYASYNASNPPSCGNPPLPDGGDQCCHTTANSTLTFHTTIVVDDKVNRLITQTGIVTAGAFLGHTVIVTFQMNIATVNFNCNKPYGQETMVGLSTTEILNGLQEVISCLNGMTFVEQCPGSGP